MPQPEANASPRDTVPASATDDAAPVASTQIAEIGGRAGLDPVRYGDWEKNGRCIDF